MSGRGRTAPVRWRWLAALMLVVVLVAAGCGGTTTGGGGTSEQPAGAETSETGAVAPQPAEEVTVIGPWSGAEMDQFTPALKAAEEALNLKINYRIYRAEDLANVLPPQFAASQAPGDLIFMWDWWVKENAQFATDLSSVWQPNASEFVMPAAEADGKVVAVPYALTVKPGFWYRKSFFEKNGLTPPTSWDEFMALLDKISKIEGIKDPIVSGDGTGWPLSDFTEHFLITFGGPDLERGLIDGSVKWTDPKVRDVFANYLIPTLKYASDPIEWTQAVDLWWNGDYALYFQGNFITGMVDDPADLGVFTLPGAMGMVAGTDYMFVPTTSQHAAAAEKLAAYLVSKEGMTERAKEGGKLSGRRDVPSDVYPPADKALADAVANITTTLPDLDDTVGGDWQRTFWDQLKLLWVEPDSLDDALANLQDAREKQDAQQGQ